MTERKLGKGLDFLIKRTGVQEEKASELEAQGKVPLSAIRPNKYQPRRTFEIDGLNDLIESVRIHGIIQPIALRKLKVGYELISGERRWRAAQELGLEDIPAVVHEVSDQEMLEIALIENIQREDLDPIEKGKAYRQLMQEFSLTQEEVAKRLGQRRSTVANFIRLLELTTKIQDMVVARLLTMGQARALLAFKDDNRRLAVARDAAQGKLTVRAIEKLARGEKAPANQPRPRATNHHIAEVTARLRLALGAKVSLSSTGKKGRIVIDYFDNTSLNRILECIEAGASDLSRQYQTAALAEGEALETSEEL